MKIFRWMMAGLVAFGVTLSAQAKPKGVPPKDQMVLQFPDEVDSADFTIETWLLAKSGFHLGRGRIVGTQCAIDLGGADELRVIVFSPKYQSVLINVPDLRKDLERHVPVKLQPTAPVPFAGKVDLPAGVDGRGYRLEVFFEWQDGAFVNYVPGPPASFTAAAVDLKANGAFQTTIPDLFHDPELAKWGGVGIGSASLHLVLRPRKAGAKIANLKFRETSGGECFRGVEESYGEIKLEAVRKGR